MGYKSRSAKRVARKSKRNLIITFVLIIGLLYATASWILPSFVGMIGQVNGMIRPSKNVAEGVSITLAPPILNIPYEATSTAVIDIKGYANPNSKVKIYLDDREIKSVDVPEDGSFTASDIGLSFGLNNIFGKTVDENDKESLPSKTFIITFDDEKPNLRVNEPEDNKQVQGDRKLKISGNTEVGAQVFINNSQTIVDKDGNFSTEIQLNDGENNFNIKSQDDALNSTETSRKVIFTP